MKRDYPVALKGQGNLFFAVLQEVSLVDRIRLLATTMLVV